jgi:FKBP-type peptidyl-prolyl cis-trans isomerase SlyD
MKVSDNCVVSMHYTLTDSDGKVIDSSVGGDPLKYLHGAGNIIPGLEMALLGCEVGDNKKVTVQPIDGYGVFDESLIKTLPRDAFSGIDEIEVGMEFQAQGDDGVIQAVVVTDISDEGITIDANHELAGMILHFDVTIDAVRESTPEELDHGHVH